MTQSKKVNAEICIWNSLTEKRITRDLERAAREYAKKEYGLKLTHNRFSNGMENLKNEKMVISEEGESSATLYEKNPDSPGNKVQLLELVAAEYGIIKKIRKEAAGFEAKLKEFEAESLENKKLTELIVTNRKRALLTRIHWLTLIQNEGDCPKFLEDEVAVQKELAEKTLKQIHATLKKLDIRLAAQSSATMWKAVQKKMGRVADEHENLYEEYKKLNSEFPN